MKQGPAIYQHLQDTAFENEYKSNGDKLCLVFFDDTWMGDDSIQGAFETLRHVLTVARRHGIQYRLVKCNFMQSEVLFLGFVISAKGRTADPKKVKQLREWPEYKSCADTHSHLAFANYLREYFGPDYSEETKPLRAYVKKGADVGQFAADIPGQQARKWLIEQTIDKVILVHPDFEAASRPWQSGRPFEVYIEASDLAWCVVDCDSIVSLQTTHDSCQAEV